MSLDSFLCHGVRLMLVLGCLLSSHSQGAQARGGALAVASGAQEEATEAPTVSQPKRNPNDIYRAVWITGVGVTIISGTFYLAKDLSEEIRTRARVNAWYGVGGLWVAVGMITAADYLFLSP